MTASQRETAHGFRAYRRLATALLPMAQIMVQPVHGQEPERAPFEVYEASIVELQEALGEGRVTSVGLVDAYMARIRAYDQAGPELNAILHLNVDARPTAARLDAERASGSVRGPLHGIPILLKDNFNTSDMPTTGGSVAMAGHVPPVDATAVRMLREAGAVILGKTSMHEMAYGYTSISSLGGQPRNPYDPSRLPGGSSGGTGAAISASLAALGWGSDTCGSIRVPAVLNGLFGLRPTKGLSSISGILPLAHTQDVQGPLARSVSDLAIGLDATVGYDPDDSATSILRDRALPGFVDALDADALSGVRIGAWNPYFGDSDQEAETSAVIRAALQDLVAAGAELVEIDEDLSEVLGGTSVIRLEFKFDLLDYLSASPGAPVRSLGEILERGLYHDAVAGVLQSSEAVDEREGPDWREAVVRREAAAAEVLRLLDEQNLDALAYPAVRRPAGRIGEGQAGVNCGVSAATGFPAMAIPAGLTTEGLPVGFQLLGRPLDDARLVGFAYAFEQVARPRTPPPTTPPLEQQ